MSTPPKRGVPPPLLHYHNLPQLLSIIFPNESPSFLKLGCLVDVMPIVLDTDFKDSIMGLAVDAVCVVKKVDDSVTEELFCHGVIIIECD
jgi:hypothetical protein